MPWQHPCVPRLVSCLIALACVAGAVAEDGAPITAGAQHAIDRYNAAVAKLKEQLAKDLDKEISKVLRVDNEKSLDYANAIRAKKEELCGEGPGAGGTGFELVSAAYVCGTDSLDVTAYFRKKVADGHLSYTNNDTLWKEVGDPHPGTAKDVVITYRMHGVQHTATARTGETLTLP